MESRVDNVVELGAHIPQDVREAAKLAYIMRIEHQAAQERLVNAMRALSKACKRFHLDPGSLLIGDLDGRALVPAAHYEREGDEHG